MRPAVLFAISLLCVTGARAEPDAIDSALGAADAPGPPSRQDSGLGQAQPISLVGLQAEGAAFALPAGRGRYLTAMFRGDYAPDRVISFGIRVPYQILQVDGAGTRTGLGDLSLGAKVLVGDFDGGAIALGVAATLPTGSPERGLGDGQVSLNPFLKSTFWFDVFVLQVSVGDAITLPGGRGGFPQFIDPHTDHELQYALGFGVQLWHQLTLSALVDGVTVLVPTELGDTLLNLGPQVRWTFAKHWQIVGSGRFPIFGEHRIQWQADAALHYLF